MSRSLSAERETLSSAERMLPGPSSAREVRERGGGGADRGRRTDASGGPNPGRIARSGGSPDPTVRSTGDDTRRGPRTRGRRYINHAYADRTTGVRTYESDGRRVAGASRKTPKTTIPRRSENTTQIHAIRSPHAAARHARRAPGPARTPKSPPKTPPERNELSTKNKTVQKHVRLLVGYFTPM